MMPLIRLFPAIVLSLCVVMGFASSGAFAAAEEEQSAAAQAPDDWAMNATIIEACSCPMFCQCYFNEEPAAHATAAGGGEHAGHAAHAGHAGAGEHYCKFNNAYKVNSGHWGDVQLDGAKFWASGDLGSDFGDGSADWMFLTFDPSVTPQQRQAIQSILGHIYPVKWESFTIGDDKPIEWNATRDKAEARLDGGKAAEVVLKKNQGMDEEPIVIQNMRYFGAPRNDGFVLMQNEVEALRQAPEGQEPYEFKGTNGFMITLDINSEDMKQSSGGEESQMPPSNQ